MKVVFGRLTFELLDLGPLDLLGGLYDAYGAAADAVPDVRVSVIVDPARRFGGLPPGEIRVTHKGDDQFSLDVMLFQMTVSLGACLKVVLRVGEWWEEGFDQAMRCLVQIAAALSDESLTLHASAVARDGEGYVFAAHAETGKTTVARFSRSLGYTVLTEELTFLGWQDGRATIYSLPVLERERLNPSEPASAPLVGVYRLVQSTRDEVVAMTPPRRVLEVASVAAIGVRLPFVMASALRTVDRLVAEVEPRYLRFRRSPAFWAAVDRDRERRGVVFQPDGA
jgi:hypothetical protein